LRKEIVIKIVPTPAYVFYILSAILITGGIQRFLDSAYLAGTICLVAAVVAYFLKKAEPKKTKEVIKITDEKLWIRNSGYKPWDTIICIKFRYSNHNVCMDVYQTNEVVADEEVNLRGISMPTWRLKWILKKYVRVENH